MTDFKSPRSEMEWSRRAIINVVGVLEAHADSLTLVGAHAVLLRTMDLDLPRMPTGDGDLGVTPGLVSDLPSIETLLTDAGYEHRTTARPGLWGRESYAESDDTRSFREKIDLLAPHGLSGTASRSRRGVPALKPAHGKLAVGNVLGLELAAFNRSLMTLTDFADPALSVDVHVAEIPALILAKGSKIGERLGEPRKGERKLGPIGSFTKHPELHAILRKVEASDDSSLTSRGITNDRQHRYTDRMHEENPGARALMSKGNPNKLDASAFGRLPFIFHEDKASDKHGYVEVLGLSERKRTTRWLRRDYIVGPPSLDAYKVVFPEANGTGATTDFFGVALNNPTVLGPGVAVTSTFLTIGSFESAAEAEALLTYLKSKFARAMLGVLKVTQHTAAHTWRHVPNQDFTDSSDIDWTQPIPEIDTQLYAKYGLDPDEIEFIETHVRPME